MRILLRQSLAIVLSAAVLATAMLPPAVCHTHQGGDVQHAHSATDTHSHAHHSDSSDSHAASHHASGDCDHSHERTADHVVKQADDHAHGLEPAVAHRHLLIAGFDFTIPQPAGDGPGRGDGESSSDRIAVVRLTEDAFVVQSVEPASPFALAGCFDSSIADLSDANRSALRSLLEAAGDRSLLCDSARFERSGVLLI